MELTELAGIGPVRAETLRAMGIFSLRDLLYTLPVRYEDHSHVSSCATKQEGMILITGKILQDPKISVRSLRSAIPAEIFILPTASTKSSDT